MAEKKDIWDKLSAVAGLVASVLIPIVVVVVGNAYASAVKDAENRVKYTELAIGILRAPPTEGTQGIRSWAIDVVNKHSGVSLDDATRTELLQNGIAGKVDAFVSTSWIPEFAKNFIVAVRKDPEWQEAMKSGDPKQIEKIVEELLIEAGQQVLNKRRELVAPINEELRAPNDSVQQAPVNGRR